MSETPCSEASDLIISRQSSPAERLSDTEAELDADCGQETHRSEIELQIPIYVETLTGTTFKLLVFASDTIYNIKAQLENVEGIPVSQQHLIWQNQELRNEFTVEDYGISFGTILRLVIDLRGGPISKSPNFFDNSIDIDETIVNSDVSQSRPLTVLVFQNGDQIKMFTITPNDSIATNEETHSDDFGSSTDLKKTVNNEKNEFRIKEDEILKIKMNEIQAKMESIALRRIDSKKKKNCVNEDKQFNEVISNRKLPALETASNLNSNSNRIKTSKNRKKTLNSIDVHLPAIPNRLKVDKDSKTKLSNNSKAEKSLRFERELNIIKHVLQSNDCTVSLSKRPNSLSPNKLNQVFGNQIQQYSELWSKLQLIDEKKTNTSTIGSVVETEDIKRARTAPFVGRIDTNSIPLLAKVSELGPKQKMRKEMFVNNRKISSPQKLPPIRMKKKSNRVRCCFCRIKLGIVNKYDCRCGLIFCAKHRYSEAHNCTFDYKEEGKIFLNKNNPIVSAPKLPKI